MSEQDRPQSIEISHEEDQGRYAAYENGELVGYVTYVINGDVVTIPSTKSFREGRGIGSALVHAALVDIRARGDLSVIPRCPFVARYIEANPEFEELLDAAWH